MAAAAAVKTDLLVKDELDPVVDGALIVTSLKSETAASFKNSDNNGGGDIKDEFTDEMEDDNGSGGDQDTETDELNDAEEINDEMTVMEEEDDDDEDGEGSGALLLDDEEEHHQLLVHDEDDDPLNDPLLGDHHLHHGEENGDDEEDMVEGEQEEVMNGDNHDDDEGDTSCDVSSSDLKLSTDEQTVTAGGRGGKSGGVKRKAAEAEVTSEDSKTETATVRKSSRIRILLDLRKEKEESMLQGLCSLFNSSSVCIVMFDDSRAVVRWNLFWLLVAFLFS